MIGNRYYLAGPMSGWPEHNFPAFHAAAARLRSRGYVVMNPAENVAPDADTSKEETKRRAYYMRLDLFQIMGRNPRTKPVDAVVLLPDWHRSRGARLEVEVALQLDIPVLWADTLQHLTEGDLDVAREYLHDEYLKPNYKGVSA